MNKFIYGGATKPAQFIARTGIMIALTIAFQWACLSIFPGITMVTGSIVNMFIILGGITCGLLGGLIIAAITPILGSIFHIGLNIACSPFIAIGNMIFVVLFIVVVRAMKFSFKNEANFGEIIKGYLGIIIGAVLKMLFLYFFFAKLMIPALGLIPAKMIPKVSMMMGWVQLWTALIGGAIAMLIGYSVKKTELADMAND